MIGLWGAPGVCGGPKPPPTPHRYALFVKHPQVSNTFQWYLSCFITGGGEEADDCRPWSSNLDYQTGASITRGSRPVSKYVRLFLLASFKGSKSHLQICLNITKLCKDDKYTIMMMQRCQPSRFRRILLRANDYSTVVRQLNICYGRDKDAWITHTHCLPRSDWAGLLLFKSRDNRL